MKLELHPTVGQLITCPRCGRQYPWKDEYVDHAWNERP